jgi:hypothetical protein
MGLGPVTTFSLASARVAASDAKSLLQAGVDPIEHGNAERKSMRTLAFHDAAATFIAARKSGCRNAKHIDQWKNTLATYADPKIGRITVDKVSTEDVLRVLAPIWQSNPETASRLRG